jgi:endonuclease YncB( thermonuclease family)
MNMFIPLALAYTMLGSTHNAIVMPSVEVIVIDGDTLKVDRLRLRLAGIDAPEMQQTGGAKARDRLKHIVARSSVITCRLAAKDRFGRFISTCFDIYGNDLADMLVRDGFAFAYRRYALTYDGAEQFAKTNKRGLWQGEVVFPWDFRASRKR